MHYKTTLAAGADTRVPSPGRFFKCTAATADFEIAFGNGAFMPCAKGVGFDMPFEYDSVRVRSDTAQTIEFFSSLARVNDDRLILAAGSDALSVVSGAVTMGASSAVTAVQNVATSIIAANVSRKAVIVYNEGPQAVYIQPSNTAAKSPWPIAVGGVLPIPSQQALWAYNTAGSDSQLYVAEIT